MGRPRKNPLVQTGESGLTPETVELAELILDGIANARPNDPKAPRTVDAVVRMALQDVRTKIQRVFPEYFETKPAVAELKAVA